MLWTEPNPFPLFNDKFLSIPIGMEVKSIKVFDEIRNQFHQAKARAIGSKPNLVPTFNNRIVSIPMGTEVKSIQFLMTLKIIFNSCKRN
jgi:hypothetical protein